MWDPGDGQDGCALCIDCFLAQASLPSSVCPVAGTEVPDFVFWRPAAPASLIWSQGMAVPQARRLGIALHPFFPTSHGSLDSAC